eukprot:76847-Prorocentrum_lima.AAC.1
MTSSLVGSEMCIRDSPIKRSLTETLKRAETDASNEDHLLGGREMLHLIFCLLYTSDAADDM